jgi:hypothetical protein
VKSAIPTKTCKACGAEIIWAVVEESGLRMPVNPEPTPDGNVLLSVVVQGGARRVGIGGVFCPAGTLLARILKKGEEVDEGRPRRVAHFTTCPKAGAFRKKRENEKS